MAAYAEIRGIDGPMLVATIAPPLAEPDTGENEAPAAGVDREVPIGTLDELVEADEPLEYDLTVERAGDNILLQGQITMRLQCECARCLRAFEHRVELQGWSCLLPLNGDEKIELINNSGDLTPYLREDTFLAFPQHPLCEPGCDGSPKLAWGESKPLKITEASGKTSEASVWSKLDNLNL